MVEISFITPIFNNTKKELEELIESIEKQKIEEYEIILINDGSTSKETNQFCQTLLHKKEINYIYQDNLGSAVARKKGLNLATGKYIVFLDADDLLTDDFYKKFCEIKHKAFDIMIFDYSLFDKNHEDIHTLKKEKDFTNQKNDLIESTLFGVDKYNYFMFGSIWGKCFSNDFLKQNKINFSDKLRKAQDRMFMLKSYFYAEKILYYPIHEYRYRQNNCSICHNINYKMIDYYHYLFEEMREFCDKNNIDNNAMRYLEFGIVTEIMPLTIFHIDNIKKQKEKKEEYRKLINDYHLQDKMKVLKLNDFKSFKRKVKYLLYRYNMFHLLQLYHFIEMKKSRTSLYNH